MFENFKVSELSTTDSKVLLKAISMTNVHL